MYASLCVVVKYKQLSVERITGPICDVFVKSAFLTLCHGHLDDALKLFESSDTWEIGEMLDVVAAYTIQHCVTYAVYQELQQEWQSEEDTTEDTVAPTFAALLSKAAGRASKYSSAVVARSAHHPLGPLVKTMDAYIMILLSAAPERDVVPDDLDEATTHVETASDAVLL